MTGLDDFAKRIDRIAVQVEGNVEKAVKDCAGAVARSVISNTPVDTGRARSNWTAQMDAAFNGLFPARVPGEKGSTGEANAAAAVEAAEKVIETFDIEKNAEVHITNNLPYIGALNDGHSKQAPADFVRLAVMDGLATVRGAKVVDG
jgi:HK97 gp10 family phage protein